MSGASWQEGAGGGMLVDGLRDGGRVNNTQLIALFPSSWRKKKKKRTEILSQAAKDQPGCALWIAAPGAWTGVISDGDHQRMF